jgi:hypothetical protein
MRIKTFFVASLLMFNVVLLYAQVTPPPDCSTPDDNCPIDNWIIYLAGGAIIFTVIHLYRKDKRIPSQERALNKV